MSSRNPLLSVVMPVYNGERYLAQAIESILTQTFDNFELIIINDGSSDGSEVIICSYDDPRIRYFSQKNQGLAKTLNKAISLASGHMIARQDQDDISLPARFEKQVQFLESHSEVGLVGTFAHIFVDSASTNRMIIHPVEDVPLKIGLLFNNFFVHSSVVFRKSLFDTLGGYCEDPARQPPEDYELWSRMARVTSLANMPEPLIIYREVPGSMSRSKKKPFANKLELIGSENLSLAIGLYAQSQAVRELSSLMVGSYGSLSGLNPFALWMVLNKALCGVCAKNSGHTLKYWKEILRWQKYFLMRYCDYLSGGCIGLVLRDNLKK